jgi:hypothetical protein
MSFDVALILVIVGGVGLSIAYVKAEYTRWRQHGAAERRRKAALRDLHAARLSSQQETAQLPSVLTLQGFGADQTASPDSANDAAVTNHPARRPVALRTYPEERRKRDRQLAAR